MHGIPICNPTQRFMQCVIIYSWYNNSCILPFVFSLKAPQFFMISNSGDLLLLIHGISGLKRSVQNNSKSITLPAVLPVYFLRIMHKCLHTVPNVAIYLSFHKHARQVPSFSFTQTIFDTMIYILHIPKTFLTMKNTRISMEQPKQLTLSSINCLILILTSLDFRCVYEFIYTCYSNTLLLSL